MINSSTWYGAQVFYSDNDAKNEYLAKLIQNELCKDTNTKRKIKTKKQRNMNLE